MLKEHPDVSHRPSDSQVLALAQLSCICPIKVSFEAAFDCAKNLERELFNMTADEVAQQSAVMTAGFKKLLVLVRGLMEEYQSIKTDSRVIEEFRDIARVGASIQCLLWSLNPETCPDDDSVVWSKLLDQNLKAVRQYLGAFADLQAA
jgi:hypothetical protein